MRVATVQADEAEGKVLPVEEVCAINAGYFTEIVHRAMKLGPSIARLCVGGTADEIAARIHDGHKGIFAELPRVKQLDDETKKKIRALIYTRNE
jgi:hypothetical protein